MPRSEGNQTKEKVLNSIKTTGMLGKYCFHNLDAQNVLHYKSISRLKNIWCHSIFAIIPMVIIRCFPALTLICTQKPFTTKRRTYTWVCVFHVWIQSAFSIEKGEGVLEDQYINMCPMLINYHNRLTELCFRNACGPRSILKMTELWPPSSLPRL